MCAQYASLFKADVDALWTTVSLNIQHQKIGLGAIGQAIINELRAVQCSVMGYDKKLNNVNISSKALYANNLEQIIHDSDIIFGCTGTDITQALNFDTAGEVEPAEDIQLTRGLLLGGILRAIVCSDTQPPADFLRYMLHPDIQQYVAFSWKKHRSRPLTNDTLNQFCKHKWIEKNSGGTYFDSKIISKIFRCKINEVIKNPWTWDMMMHKKVTVTHSF